MIQKLCPPKFAWCCVVLALFNFLLMVPLAVVMKSGNPYLRLATTEKSTGGEEKHESTPHTYEQKATVMFLSALFYAGALAISLLSIWRSRVAARQRERFANGRAV